MLTDKRHAPPKMRQNKHEGTRECPKKQGHRHVGPAEPGSLQKGFYHISSTSLMLMDTINMEQGAVCRNGLCSSLDPKE